MDISDKYKYRSNLILTKQEGEVIDKLIKQYECENASQLLKKVANGNLSIVNTKELKALRDSADLEKVNNEIRIDNFETMIHEMLTVLQKHHYNSITEFADDVRSLKSKIQ